MSNDEYILRQKICEIGRRMYERKMVAANDGNISVRLNENEFLCTPTLVSKGYMDPECICKVDIDGNLIESSGGYRPSSEMKMHLRAYSKKSDIKAVVHAHPTFATCFAVARKPLAEPIIAEAIVSLGYVPVAPYATPSTKEVPDSIEPYLNDFEAVLLANHGVLTWSDDLEKAYMRMESVEFYAELIYRTKLMGDAVAFRKEEIEKLYEVRKGMGLKACPLPFEL